MRMPWKSAGLFVLVGSTTGLLGVLGSVTHGDVVRYHGWIDPAYVASAQLGQYYIVGDDGAIHDALCELKAEDFDPPLQPSSIPGRKYVNSLGRLTPFLIQLVGTLLPAPQAANAGAGPRSLSHVLEFKKVEREAATASALTRLTSRVFALRDVADIEKNAGPEASADARRLGACAAEIRRSLADGLNVCQVNEVVRDGSSGLSIGVRFATRCLARPTDERPRLLPDLDRGSLFSNVKHSLDLLEIEPAA